MSGSSNVGMHIDHAADEDPQKLAEFEARIDAGELIAHRFGRQLRVSAEDLKTFEKLRRGV